MNWVAAVVTFILMGWTASTALVFSHLFRGFWIQYPLVFIGVAFGVLAAPVSFGVVFWVGG